MEMDRQRAKGWGGYKKKIQFTAIPVRLLLVAIALITSTAGVRSSYVITSSSLFHHQFRCCCSSLAMLENRDFRHSKITWDRETDGQTDGQTRPLIEMRDPI